MTELETLERAKMYLDKLANGIDPLSGREIPEGETVNQVRISRCLFYVSGVLEQLIQRGGLTPPVKEKKEKKLPFSLDLARREQFAYSDGLISVSEIAARISALCGEENMRKLKYKSIITWLVGVGALEDVDVNGKIRRRPTAMGEQLGIHMERRLGQAGEYWAVLYDRGAQAFILDNLEAILAIDSAAKTEDRGMKTSGV